MTAVRVVLAGGGTAGHTSPLIATAQALQALTEVDLVCIGTPKGLESRVIPDAGLSLKLIPPVPLPRRLGLDLLRVPGRLLGAVSEAKKILAEHRAQVVVGFGGYVSLPAYLAARKLRIPVVIHEGNAVPGLANRVAARFASVVATSFPDTKLPGADYVGLPVRSAITDLDRAARRDAARNRFGLPVSGRVLLVSGGSQGARSLNTATLEARDRLLASGVSVLHVLGAANLQPEHQTLIDHSTQAVYHPVGYVDDMGEAYSAADLMLARAGAATVMETAIVGLPTLFVPLPHGNGEQARNAAFLIEADAGILIPDQQLNSDRLLDEVTRLFDDPSELERMGTVAKRSVAGDAAQRLARRVLRAAGVES